MAVQFCSDDRTPYVASSPSSHIDLIILNSGDPPPMPTKMPTAGHCFTALSLSQNSRSRFGRYLFVGGESSFSHDHLHVSAFFDTSLARSNSSSRRLEGMHWQRAKRATLVAAGLDSSFPTLSGCALRIDPQRRVVVPKTQIQTGRT